MTRIASVCSGYEGLGIAVQSVLGGDLAWVADNDPGASKILAHCFPDVPNLGDITRVDWSAVPRVDILTGGFPCQDLSLAGLRNGMTAGTRSNLWREFARAISILRPRLVVIENVRGLLSQGADSPVEPCPWCLGNQRDEPVLRALGAVLGDLADLGFDAEWHGLPASDAGAPHERWREFILAWPAAENTHSPAGIQWRPAASGQTESRRAWADTRGRSGVPATPASVSTGRLSLLPTPAARDWKSGASNLMEQNSRPLNEVAVNLLDHIRQPDAQWIATDGTDYGPAIRRWEVVLGRPAPCPTEPGPRGGRRLSARFTEWMQGLDDGHVTAVPGLDYRDQIRALGNGVVPQQAAMALRHLLPAMTEAAA